MSEYELVSLLNESFNAVLNSIETFMAALFAMLVGAYIAGPKLTRSMSVTIVGLFTAFSAVSIFFVFVIARRTGGVVFALDGLPSQDLDVSWLITSPAAARILPTGLALLLVAAYCATLVFFVQARRAGFGIHQS